MTDRNVRQHRTVASLQDTVRWLSVVDEEIPAYGVIQFRNNLTAGYSQGSKPNGMTGLFFVNGHVPVAVASYGESQVWSRPQLVLIDGSPTVGDIVGPVDDEWFMSTDGVGFCVIHQPVAGVGSVVQVGGGSPIKKGIVLSESGGGRWNCEIAEWGGNEATMCDGVNPDDTCDPCLNVIDEGTSACAISLVIPACQFTGTGVFVRGYHGASKVIGLETGQECLLVNHGDVEMVDDVLTPVWMMIDPMMRHIVQYKERWSCCDGEGETGVETLLGRTPVILIGRECSEIECGTCEVP